MKISTAVPIACAIGIVLSATTLGLVYLMNDSIDSERKYSRRQIESRELGNQLREASNLLTREAQYYTIFGDKRHFDAYWKEVNETKTRDRVVERLKELGARSTELALIEEAKRNSDALIATEKKAMDAVRRGDMQLAQTLMFDDNYCRAKKGIMDPIEKFQQVMKARVSKDERKAREKASWFLMLTSGAILAYVVSVIAALYFLFLRRVVTPLVAIARTMTRISEGEFDAEIPYRGLKSEVGHLAESAEHFKVTLAANIGLAANLREYQNNLEQKVENRTVQLRQSIERMRLTQKALFESNKELRDVSLKLDDLSDMAHQDRLKSMGRLASAISHELNQPLMVICNTIYGLQSKITNMPDMKEAYELATTISEQAVRAGEIVHRMRGFATKNESIRELADLNSLVDEAVKMVEIKTRHSDVQLNLEKGSSTPLVLMDSVQILQVLVNLILNASEAMLTQKTDRAISVETGCGEDDMVFVRVSDTGPGISKKNLNLLFAPFESTKEDGMGLGLAISRSIVDNHDGVLTVDSDYVGGASFLLFLPMCSRVGSDDDFNN